MKAAALLLRIKSSTLSIVEALTRGGSAMQEAISKGGRLQLPAALDELKQLKQWVCCTLAPMEDGKLNKVPFNPETGKAAKANDPSTWGSYQAAAEAIKSGRYKGIGFEFATGGGYVGIDLDHVIDLETGEISPYATAIIAAFDSYTEYSPSGTGFHIFIKVSSTEGIYTGKRNNSSPIDIEIYSKERYLTITGRAINDRPIEDRTEIAREYSRLYIKKEDKAAAPAALPSQSVGSYQDKRSNAELWQRMFSSGKGDEIKALYDGDTGSYGGDHSRADQALVNHLCYWTNGDAARIDELFRESGLYRSEKIEGGVNKWDKRHGSMTYGEKTIQKALANFTPYVAPARAAKVEAAAGTLQPSEDEPTEEQQPQKAPAFNFENVSGYIYGIMGKDLERFQKFKDRKTGFRNLDAITSLYPGLYVIGAISSLGKTTFAHQMGDQIAATGDHVIYFSLEQTRLEMVTKGISRMSARQTIFDSFKGATSAIDIRRGNVNDTVREAAKAYAEQAKTETVIECGFDTSIETIISAVLGYIREKEEKPIVIVDYLQIIRPIDPRQTTKDAVDSHIRALKKLQTDNDLVVIVICSLNRANYLTPIDFEAFKESGGIEYTADVVWGLQLEVMNDEIFSKDKNIKEKREKIKAAKLAVPRKVQLICLKNRYGRSSYDCGFNYYPQYDLFIPEDDFVVVDPEDNPFKQETFLE